MRQLLRKGKAIIDELVMAINIRRIRINKINICKSQVIVVVAVQNVTIISSLYFPEFTACKECDFMFVQRFSEINLPAQILAFQILIFFFKDSTNRKNIIYQTC